MGQPALHRVEPPALVRHPALAPDANDPALPVVVWAFARRPAPAQSPVEGATGYADKVVAQPLP